MSANSLLIVNYRWLSCILIMLIILTIVDSQFRRCRLNVQIVEYWQITCSKKTNWQSVDIFVEYLLTHCCHATEYLLITCRQSTGGLLKLSVTHLISLKTYFLASSFFTWFTASLHASSERTKMQDNAPIRLAVSWPHNPVKKKVTFTMQSLGHIFMSMRAHSYMLTIFIVRINHKLSLTSDTTVHLSPEGVNWDDSVV